MTGLYWISIVPVLLTVVLFSSCGKSRPVKETVTLPSGQKIERTAVGGSQEIERFVNRTVTGKIEMVSNHPSPGSLPPEIRKGTEVVTLLTDKGERVVVVNDKESELRKNAGKMATIEAELQREPARLANQNYAMLKLTKIKEIK
ncbi:MAG: hypothetical protein ACYC5N_04935 [Endomicrobiales bacterium]